VIFNLPVQAQAYNHFGNNRSSFLLLFDIIFSCALTLNRRILGKNNSWQAETTSNTLQKWQNEYTFPDELSQ